jgi:hypothetical protein
VERRPNRHADGNVGPGGRVIDGHSAKSANQEIRRVGSAVVPADSNRACIVNGCARLKLVRATPVCQRD